MIHSMPGQGDPHAGQPVQSAGAPLEHAEAAMVMLHGRGGTAESILELAGMLDHPSFAYLAPQAAGNTWYPHSFLKPRRDNEPNVSSALRAVGAVVHQLETSGFAHRRIMLLGFSQGACLAAEFAARNPSPYAGVGILTGGLIGERVESRAYEGAFEGMPALLCSGDPDPHIPWERVEQTAEVYRMLGAAVSTRRYSGRPHTVSLEEIELVREMMANALQEHG